MYFIYAGCEKLNIVASDDVRLFSADGAVIDSEDILDVIDLKESVFVIGPTFNRGKYRQSKQ